MVTEHIGNAAFSCALGATFRHGQLQRDCYIFPIWRKDEVKTSLKANPKATRDQFEDAIPSSMDHDPCARSRPMTRSEGRMLHTGLDAPSTRLRAAKGNFKTSLFHHPSSMLWHPGICPIKIQDSRPPQTRPAVPPATAAAGAWLQSVHLQSRRG
ncbi:hypothetical protein E4U23_003441 [Claviceps purpurea]|nr:hypothetical protein E4U23_003441 [Claviceps purpurea]